MSRQYQEEVRGDRENVRTCSFSYLIRLPERCEIKELYRNASELFK